MVKISCNGFRRGSTALALVMVLASHATAAAAREQSYTFHIPAENAAKALNDFSRQAGVQILFPYDQAAAHDSQAIDGRFTRTEILSRLLQGTGLEIAEISPTSITLRVAGKSDSQAVQGAGTAVEVVVTGSHIRGGDPTSPVHTITRNEIDQSGYSTIGEVMRSLPENFSGGQNPEVFNGATVNTANNNQSNASSLDLRGLGSDATLTLVDGHRLSADSTFQGADISGIPLAAVERVEVVTDGASAVYGSDAVAGVANIIMRRDYNAAEFNARVAGATQGGGEDDTTSLLAGHASSTSFELLNYEYDDQSGVRLGQRSALPDVASDDTLLQPQRRQSVFVSAGRTLSDQISISFDGLFSDRNTLGVFQQNSSGTEYFSQVKTPAYSAALSASVALAGDWKLHLVGVASGSRNTSLSWANDDPSVTYSVERNDVAYGEATADGSLFTLPSGDVKAAFGGGYRTEGFRQDWSGAGDYINPSRHIAYAYGEARAPLVAPSPDRIGLNALDLSLSVRTERYSDVGVSTNPRVGLRYVPIPDLTLRATWGKSFKAPSFYQLYSASYLFLWNASTLGYSGPGTALMTNGGNPDLKPERSTSWTFGGEYHPSFLPSLKLSATYFNIDYRDRIVQPVANVTAFYSDPDYATFILPAPSAAAQAAMVSSATYFYNFSGSAYSPSTVINVLEDSYINATSQTVDGVDLSYRQSFALSGSQLDLFANATWLTLRQRSLPLLPEVTLSGTLGYPAHLKARGGATWQVGQFTATATANYISSENDTGISPNVPIASWTTVDANLAYHVGGQIAGWKVVAAVTNLFDKRPPFAVSPGIAVTGVNFDSTNSSDIGRLVSLTVVKDW